LQKSSNSSEHGSASLIEGGYALWVEVNSASAKNS
jgi:hypothetical protein